MSKPRYWLKVALVAGMFIYGMLAIALILPLLRLLTGRRAESLFEPIRSGWCSRLCRILGVQLQVQGAMAAEARLLVANHISWLDILVLGATGPMVFVAKAEVADWPVMGYLAKGVGTLFVKRGDSAQTSLTAERMAWQLRQGKRLMLFPEGTTTAGDKVLRFHARLLQPAVLAQVPVQSLAIEYLGPAKTLAPFIDDDDFLTHLLRILALDGIAMRLSYAPALAAAASRGELAQATRGQVVAMLFPPQLARASSGEI